MAEKIMGIYYILNMKTDQMYIGSSVDISSRVKRHVLALTNGKHHSKYLQRAWDKYGQASFDYGIAEMVEERAHLQAREQEWIDHFGTYNVAKFADRPQPPEMTDDRRQRMSELMKGRKGTMTGKKHSPETLALLSLQRKGVKRPGVGAAISAGKMGCHIPDSAKEKLREGARNRWDDPIKRAAFLANFESLKAIGMGPWVHHPSRKQRERVIRHDAHVRSFKKHNKLLLSSPKYRLRCTLMTQADLPVHDAHVILWKMNRKSEAAAKTMRRNWADPEFAKKSRSAQLGVKRTDAQKAAISAANTGKTWTDERRARYQLTVKTPETQAKLSAARKGIPWSPEMREKILAARAATNAIKKAMKSAALETCHA